MHEERFAEIRENYENAIRVEYVRWKFTKDAPPTTMQDAQATEDMFDLITEVERLQAQEHFAEYVIRQNKALWEALSKACASLGADTIDYYEEEGGI